MHQILILALENSSFPNSDRKLKNNALNGTLNMGDSISLQLELVDLQNNQISQIVVEEEFKDELM